MSENGEGRESEREIVIVRRSGQGQEEGHHGGVWKIAYADFMTAMMAFFLVMWLVNASDEETKKAVASYFNPIKLMDQKPADRSINEEGDASNGKEETPASDAQRESEDSTATLEQGREQNATAGEETQYSDSDYFEKPYAVLSEIALEVGQQMNVSDAGEGGAQTSGPSTGASGGEAYRDPFDPDFWSAEMQAEERNDPTVEELDELSPEALADAGAPAAGSRADEPAQETPAPVAVKVSEAAPEEVSESAGQESVETAALPVEESEAADGALDEAAARLRSEIEAAVGDNGLGEALDVRPAEGGLLVSLTDEMQDAMFNVGSAVPRRDLVLAMEKIGGLLSERKGEVIIRGHTDARPFEGEGNDNWRLSTARAHSAYYMLVRGGLAEDRVSRIVGYADRELKLPEQPYAAANRRIEILIRPEESAGVE